MSLHVKAVLAGAALVGLGGAGIVINHFGNSMPTNWTPAGIESNFDTAYKGKYASKYPNYLVGEVEGNKDWWNWSFSNNLKPNKDSAGEGFTGIESWESLRDKCKAAYGGGETVTDGKISVTGSSTTNYHEDSFWKYCSPLAGKPITVDKDGEKYTGDIIGADDTNKTKFVSTRNNDRKNNLFWQIRDAEFYGGNSNYKSMNVSESDKYFHGEKSKDGDLRRSIREICGSAYESKKTATDGATLSPTVDETVKYCSLKVTAVAA